MSRLNSLSASALNVAVTVTLLMFPIFASTFFTGAGAGRDGAEAGGLLALLGAGDPARLGSLLIVRSLPWVSIIAEGNSANLASNATERRDLAIAKRDLTVGEASVVISQSYWDTGIEHEA